MAGSLGVEWADWDAWMPGDSAEEYTPKFPFRVYLDGLRSPFNVGSVMRTAVAFGAERLWVSPECASPLHPRCRRSAMGADGRLSWQTASLDDLTGKETGTLFALELGGTSLSDFHFPSSGTVILGSEELGVRPELMRRAESDAGVVSIALPGPKASLNVGVAFGILMQRWCEYVQTAGDS
ncbi:MAG: hypothetical protein CSA76_06330 [Spirochaetales bacterium]|nr:MAG: hypothetical protein CSA76_06330 [Spirochaetales bacterium]